MVVYYVGDATVMSNGEVERKITGKLSLIALTIEL